ncbi:hypothetical protein RGU70_13715 [Herbaspirillum sp. RTI4]|uniref:hypothetical protein n=1 Tax=Herbaspirillum sp. RTI4 TaxID=3048640 RepID=UPI002AB58319|nr:hypothetical protein [Herbaspirillum sp. RTI4]MDY7579371.1 hypothetical protein [Herbaspirillum sp. RTI4]MEA9980285.1 hypothetical protein [Herbaspirillum sp. RTI4]
MKKVLTLLAVATLTGCASAPPLSAGAARVQIQSQNSNLLAKCTTLRPVSATASAIDPYAADTRARNALREQTASVGGDVVAVTDKHVDPNAMTITLQGTAMKCYS